MRERTMAGLSSAKARGRIGGRKRLLSSQQMRVVETMWDSRDHTRQEIAAHFSVSVLTIDRALRASRLAAEGRGRDVMRVHRSVIDGYDVEGGLIWGEG